MLIPCYNEEDNVEPISKAIAAALQSEPLRKRVGDSLDYRIVFVDNCSTDRTWMRVQNLAAINPRIDGLRHAANYGQLLSPFMALCQSEAELSVLISADFEDPPALIPSLILAQLDSGADVIAAVRREDQESGWRRLSRRLGYRLMGKVSDSQSINGFHGFGLYSREAVQAFRSYKEVRPYIRLLPTYLGLRIHCVPHARDRRRHGSSSNNLGTLFELAVDGIIQFSGFPVRLITAIAVIQWFLSLLVVLAMLLWALSSGLSPQLLVSLLTCLGVSFLVLIAGVSLQYISRIYALMSGRPSYRVAATCGHLDGLSVVA
ncbi:MAG: glycosyltransferase family 2 protein [Synechococcaceae cyanobacterium]|nr:glycosyltransferase family 2 protein [Synechococcaceae cyanobacterium]